MEVDLPKTVDALARLKLSLLTDPKSTFVRIRQCHSNGMPIVVNLQRLSNKRILEVHKVALGNLCLIKKVYGALFGNVHICADAFLPIASICNIIPSRYWQEKQQIVYIDAAHH